MRKLRKTVLVALIGIVALALQARLEAPARAGDDSEQKAVNRAHEFLKTRARGTDVLSYVHMGAKYGGHNYKETLPVNDGEGNQIKGHFALVYNYKWEEDGVTHVAFLCDASGKVYKTQITYTNAVFNQPFAFANGAIKVLGNLLIEAFKDKMNADERTQVQKFVDDADAKAMLEWSLKFQQAFAK